MKRKISIVLLLFSIIYLFSGCGRKVNYYTIDEHIFRITKRVESRDSKWGFPDGETYESFEVYPVYNQYEDLQFFLVEFEPYNFLFISVRDEPPLLLSFLYSMYLVSRSIYTKDDPWARYVVDENGEELYQTVRSVPSNKRGEFITDENGEIILHDKSPFYVSGDLNERKYMLKTDRIDEYICAVKKDGKFFNLISGETIDYAETYNSKQNATLEVRFIADRIFNL